jgi:hypothetical protein
VVLRDDAPNGDLVLVGMEREPFLAMMAP